MRHCPIVLTRVIDVPRQKLYRCWTEPELLKQWFAPKPYTTPVARIDVRPGGASYIVMRDPQGNDLPNPGVVVLTFEDLGGGKTRYTARAYDQPAWAFAARTISACASTRPSRRSGKR